MKMKRLLTFAIATAGLFLAGSTHAQSTFEEHITKLEERRSGMTMKLKKGEIITTIAKFQPPIEIIVEAKTDKNNLRLGYAADQLIFNWEMDQNQLRVDGGPAGGRHKRGAGMIPADQFVKIRWLVTSGKQQVFVNNDLRFEHEGDYSKLDRPLKVFSHDSELTVKSIQTRKIAE